MRKILFVLFTFAFLFLSSAALQNVAAQTADQMRNDEDGFYSEKFLKNDFRQVAAVIYVNVREGKLVDSTGAECENDSSRNLCQYLLTADVKEVFKGRIKAKTIEFYTNPDAGYPKEKLLGEKVLFLNRGKDKTSKKMTYNAMENSTRSIEQNVLEKLRKIAKKK